MIRKYIEKAMAHARYEILSDNNSYYGEIPGFQGVYANQDTLEKCRQELEEVLEEWILFRVYKHLPVPEIEGLKLEVKKIKVA